MPDIAEITLAGHFGDRIDRHTGGQSIEIQKLMALVIRRPEPIGSPLSYGKGRNPSIRVVDRKTVVQSIEHDHHVGFLILEKKIGQLDQLLITMIKRHAEINHFDRPAIGVGLAVCADKTGWDGLFIGEVKSIVEPPRKKIRKGWPPVSSERSGTDLRI
jgi:hypothetical protein